MLEMMVSDERAFFLIPKCASISLRNALEPNGFKRVVKKIRQGKRKFYAIIRDPLERFLTAYVTIKKIAVEKGYDERRFLADFVLTVFELDQQFDKHLVSQSRYLYGDVEYISINNASEKIKEITGMEMPFMNRLKHEKEHRLITDYLNDHYHLVGRILRYYSDDLRLWREYGEQETKTGC